MKQILVKLFIAFSYIIMILFYKKKYLRGRWFKTTKGWRWCWKSLFMQKIIGYNRHVPFPVSHRINVGDYKKLHFHVDDLNNFQNFGNYYQCFNADIYIGKGTYIAPNVGIITENHNIFNLDEHDVGKDIVIGENCWIGMNSMILPGVNLMSNTIVGAGAIVTKSFNEGNIILVGNPARILRRI